MISTSTFSVHSFIYSFIFVYYQLSKRNQTKLPSILTIPSDRLTIGVAGVCILVFIDNAFWEVYTHSWTAPWNDEAMESTSYPFQHDSRV